MTTPGFTNIATGDSDVETQIGVLHLEFTTYQENPGAAPEEMFRTGVRFLAARMPAKARELIESAAARGLDTDEVRFYRVLALLSGRTLRHLGNDGLDSLLAICARLPRLTGDGEWTVGLRAVLTLLATLPGADASLVDKELAGLGPLQRDLIVDHLGVLLDGPVEDEMWRRSVELASARRMTGGRLDRVWTFFQPEPAPPRAGPVRPPTYRAGDFLRAGLGLAVAGYAVVKIGLLVLRPAEALPILAFVVAAAAAVLFVRHGADWHFRRQRILAKDAELASGPPDREAPPHGFARSVDLLFDRYFGRYVPRGADRADWIARTWGIRRRLRDEVVDMYREQRVSAKQVAWLVRFLVGDVRRQWEQDTLASHRSGLRTPGRVRALCLTGLAAFAAAVAAIVATAPLSTVLWCPVAVVAGTVAVLAGFRLDTERRRIGADAAERAMRLAERQAAFDRWKLRLSVKPTDPEMADWLESDRRVLVDQAMRHYRLKASQIIAHAVIEGPAAGTRRARVKHGPWRYSKYQMVLFLLTQDGVRQITVQLDFEAVVPQISQRLNYRFHAVSSVRIDGMATQRQTFELTLMNGPPIAVPVAEATGEIEPDENPAQLSQASLDASGLPRTLHVLEGIAAEGKEWVHHQRQRTEKRLADLAVVVRDAIDEPGTA